MAIALLWIRSAHVADRFVWKRWEMPAAPARSRLRQPSQLDFYAAQSSSISLSIDSGLIIYERLDLIGDCAAHHEMYWLHGRSCQPALRWHRESPQLGAGLARTGWLTRAGFEFDSYASPSRRFNPYVGQRIAAFPAWSLLTTLGIIVSARRCWRLWRAFRSRPRRRKQRKPEPLPRRCPRCRYDLRATPYRCPECGTILFDEEHAQKVMEVAQRLAHVEYEEPSEPACEDVPDRTLQEA